MAAQPAGLTQALGGNVTSLAIQQAGLPHLPANERMAPSFSTFARRGLRLHREHLGRHQGLLRLCRRFYRVYAVGVLGCALPKSLQ